MLIIIVRRKLQSDRVIIVIQEKGVNSMISKSFDFKLVAGIPLIWYHRLIKENRSITIAAINFKNIEMKYI